MAYIAGRIRFCGVEKGMLMWIRHGICGKKRIYRHVNKGSGRLYSGLFFTKKSGEDIDGGGAVILYFFCNFRFINGVFESRLIRGHKEKLQANCFVDCDFDLSEGK